MRVRHAGRWHLEGGAAGGYTGGSIMTVTENDAIYFNWAYFRQARVAMLLIAMQLPQSVAKPVLEEMKGMSSIKLSSFCEFIENRRVTSEERALFAVLNEPDSVFYSAVASAATNGTSSRTSSLTRQVRRQLRRLLCSSSSSSIPCPTKCGCKSCSSPSIASKILAAHWSTSSMPSEFATW